MGRTPTITGHKHIKRQEYPLHNVLYKGRKSYTLIFFYLSTHFLPIVPTPIRISDTYKDKISSASTLAANFTKSTPSTYTVSFSIDYSWSGGENPGYRATVGGDELLKAISYPSNTSSSVSGVESGTNVACGIYAGGQSNFKGWYVNGTLVSMEINLYVTIAGNTSIVAKW